MVIEAEAESEDGNYIPQHLVVLVSLIRLIDERRSTSSSTSPSQLSNPKTTRS
jgi:hypothetical protein